MGVPAGAAVAVAIYGAPAACAGTPDDVIGQAISDLSQGTQVLDTASTTDLSTLSDQLLSLQEGFSTQLIPDFHNIVSMQDMLTPTDQSFVTSVDEQLVSAAQNVLTADQAFAAADQAGVLSSNGLQPVDFTAIVADLQLVGAGINVIGADFLADLTGGLDLPSAAADLATSFGPAMADPGTFADLFTSVGL